MSCQSSNEHEPSNIVDFYKKIKKLFLKNTPIDSRCPRKLCHLPTSPCPWAINALLKINKKKQCPWFVKDKLSNNCFWVWSALYSKSDLTLEEIAELDGSTITIVNSVLNKALRRLKDVFKSPGKIVQILKTMSFRRKRRAQ